VSSNRPIVPPSFVNSYVYQDIVIHVQRMLIRGKVDDMSMKATSTHVEHSKAVDSAPDGGSDDDVRFELANRLFFRLYQCANMMHKSGTRAVESEGLTTQRWAVLGALSRSATEPGMSVGDMARYLEVSRQSLAGIIRRLETDGLILSEPDPSDGRARRLRLTDHGRGHESCTALHRASPSQHGHDSQRS
jgi:DNA-binding MarR family transcriptional regulator